MSFSATQVAHSFDSPLCQQPAFCPDPIRSSIVSFLPCCEFLESRYPHRTNLKIEVGSCSATGFRFLADAATFFHFAGDGRCTKRPALPPQHWHNAQVTASSSLPPSLPWIQSSRSFALSNTTRRIDSAQSGSLIRNRRRFVSLPLFRSLH
jgi:hypothetical protein